MTRRVVLLGATGVFGSRLAERLASWPQLELMLAARRPEPLAALKARLADRGAQVVGLALDRARPSEIVALRPWAVIDAAGPFHGTDYALALAVIEAGAHWIDLADSRPYVAGFAAALDAAARRSRVLAVTGASSTPALTSAALARLTTGWRRIDAAASVIAPGAQPPGLSLARTVLAQAGQEVDCFIGGRWTRRHAWSGAHWRTIPGLGRRLVVLADTPDLDVLPRRAREQGLFFAGVEPALLQRLIWLAAWLVRLGMASTLAPLAGLLMSPAAWLARLGDADGGMVVIAEGVGRDGEPRTGRWSLAARDGCGPAVPSAAAAAVLHALVEDRMQRVGAGPCVDLVDLDDILLELAHLPIATRLEGWPQAREELFPAVLGDSFDALPASVRQAHGGRLQKLSGRAVSAASGLGALAGRWLFGLPRRGRHAVEVEMAQAGARETWTRRFGASRFRSHLALVKGELGLFEERFGPATFRFSASCDARGFRWIAQGWRLGPVAMPRWLAPTIRARAFDRAGAYHFSVLVAHPWLGVIAAYAGRLEAP